MSSRGAFVQTSWAATRERGTFVMMRLMAFGLAVLSRPLATPVVHAATLYFFLFGTGARAASRDYLRRVARAFPDSGVSPSLACSYRHFVAFTHAILDKLDAWAGRLDGSRVHYECEDTLMQMGGGRQGLLVIGSHLGNLEVCRAIAWRARHVRLTVLVHTRHAVRFARLLARVGASEVELVQVTELDAAMAMTLRERIARGEWVVIAGDRVPVHGGRTVQVQFLGSPAPLPVGPYVLAALLDCPVYLLFCLRREGVNHVYFERFAERLSWKRAARDAVIAAAAQRYADRLAHHVRLAPLQWFNFYPFWP